MARLRQRGTTRDCAVYHYTLPSIHSTIYLGVALKTPPSTGWVVCARVVGSSRDGLHVILCRNLLTALLHALWWSLARRRQLRDVRVLKAQRCVSQPPVRSSKEAT